MTSSKSNYLLKAYLQKLTKWDLGICIWRDGEYHLAHSSQFHSNFCNDSVGSACNAGDTDVVQSLGQKDPLEEETATHSSILAWRIPWMEEPGEL